MAKEKILYQEKYKKGSMFVDQDLLPEIKHAGSPKVESAELKEASVVEIDGRKYVSHTLRVLMPKEDFD